MFDFSGEQKISPNSGVKTSAVPPISGKPILFADVLAAVDATSGLPPMGWVCSLNGWRSMVETPLCRRPILAGSGGAALLPFAEKSGHPYHTTPL